MGIPTGFLWGFPQGKTSFPFPFPWDGNGNPHSHGNPGNHTEDRIEVFDLDLVYIESFGQEILKQPGNIQAYESKIFVLTLTLGETSIHVFDSSHDYLHNIVLPGLEFDLLLCYFTMDLSGNFILSDRGAHCLKVCNAKGELIETLGNGYLTSPHGITTDRNNRIIVVSEAYNSLQVY